MAKKIVTGGRTEENLRNNILFKGFSDKEYASIRKQLKEHRYRADEVIFTNESMGDDLFLIAEGRVKITKTTKYGEETVLAFLHEMDFFGELSMIDEQPRSATAIAVEDSILYSLSKKDFDKLIYNRQPFTINLLRNISRRIRTSNETIVRELERSIERAIQDINKLTQLIDAAKTVNSTLDLDQLLRTILETALRGVNADRGTVYLLDELRGELWSKVLKGTDVVEIRLPIGVGIAGHVAKTGETVNIPDAYQDERFNPETDRRTGYRTKTILCMPLKNKDDKIIGVFQLINKNDGTFTYEDESFIDALSIHAAIAIENARLAQEMIKAERLSSIGQMASAIIHDIKNPMGTIRVYAQVMKKKAASDEVTKMADEMIRQVDRLVGMLQEILDFSRGVGATNFEEVPLGEVVDGILTFIEKDLVKNNVVLVKDLKYTGPLTIDADKITRVFYNIASNARDAMPHGGTLKVTTELVNGEVVFTFTDTGTGMPPEVKARIFEPFVTYGKKHGTGLGMAIVKKIIDDHKGRIDVESEPGKGTTMRVAIPLKRER
jgi:signal transduction histidine kinase/CRP-like cAMP-binding protein